MTHPIGQLYHPRFRSTDFTQDKQPEEKKTLHKLPQAE
jgi:hypothetical protein